jgi:predicted nucleic acid-binding protein
VGGIVTVYSLHSIAVIMERLESVNHYKRFLHEITEYDGLLLHFFTPWEEISVCEAATNHDLDFDDAYQYQAAEAISASIVSFDEDFDKTDMGRMTPQEAVEAIDAASS